MKASDLHRLDEPCDPSRNPSQWVDLVRPGQHAVFILEASTRLVCDTEGRPFSSHESASIAICDDLPEAAGFAGDLVSRHPNLCCEIYDHEGKSKEPLQLIYHRICTASTRCHYAKRLTLWGSLAFLSGAAFIAYDLSHDLTWL